MPSRCTPSPGFSPSWCCKETRGRVTHGRLTRRTGRYLGALFESRRRRGAWADQGRRRGEGPLRDLGCGVRLPQALPLARREFVDPAYFELATCDRSPGSGRPFSIGRAGSAACVTPSAQLRHAYLDRTYSRIKNEPGSKSRVSVRSVPMQTFVLSQLAQCNSSAAGLSSTISRGRSGGSGRRPTWRRRTCGRTAVASSTASSSASGATTPAAPGLLPLVGRLGAPETRVMVWSRGRVGVFSEVTRRD